MEMGFLVHIFAKQNGDFPWHPCPRGIKLLRAVIVSLFHKVGIFCDVQILFLYMLLCNSWTQHLLCILMRLNRSQRQSTVGPDRADCWAPSGTWQHGEEVSWTRRAGGRQTRCFGAVKVTVSTYGLRWIQVLPWSPLWSPLYFTTACWQLCICIVFVCKCRSAIVVALNHNMWAEEAFSYSLQVWRSALVPSCLLCATNTVFPVSLLTGPINKDSFVEGKTSIEPKKALFRHLSQQCLLDHRFFGQCGL